MKIQNSNISIAEIREMFERKDLIANKDYQRHAGIWPKNAKSYFIDTILNGYPFPKIYLYESLVGQTKKIRREIVDGQQRIATIIDFLGDEGFSLTNASQKYRGMSFTDLPDEDQNRFLAYSVPVDMILAAERSEILEMFRRMNSYTQPLNAAEKRHSQFVGEFKWYINELADEFSPMLVSFGVVTEKQVIRMLDSEFLTELCQLPISGIVNKSDVVLAKLYKDNEENFASRDEVDSKVRGVIEFMRENLGEFAKGFLFKSYVMYSLSAALMYNRWGVAKWSDDLPPPRNKFWENAQQAKDGLRLLIEAHETQDDTGPLAEYVRACTSTTHRVAQRQTRAVWLLKALNGEIG